MKRLIVAALLCGACGTANATPWFSDATANLPPNQNSYATMDAVAHDLDGDGDLDLVLPQEWRPNRILLNDSHARFTLAPALPAPREDELIRPAHIQQPLQKDTEDASVADFNGDGRIDIIMVVEDDLQFGRRNVHQYYRATANGSHERIYGQLTDTSPTPSPTPTSTAMARPISSSAAPARIACSSTTAPAPSAMKPTHACRAKPPPAKTSNSSTLTATAISTSCSA